MFTELLASGSGGGGSSVKAYELHEDVLSSYKITCTDSDGNTFKPKAICVAIKYSDTNNLCGAYIENMSTTQFFYNYANVTIQLSPIQSNQLIASINDDGFNIGTGWGLSSLQDVNIYAFG